jgi:phosphate:Na+ symporter
MLLMVSNASENIQFFEIAMGLFGGLAIFLFGMSQMTESLKIVAGDGLRTILSRLTTNRFMASKGLCSQMTH